MRVLLVNTQGADLASLEQRHFDLIGLVLMATFLGCLEYALEEGPRWDWLDDRKIRTALVAI